MNEDIAHEFFPIVTISQIILKLSIKYNITFNTSIMKRIISHCHDFYKNEQIVLIKFLDEVKCDTYYKSSSESMTNKC